MSIQYFKDDLKRIITPMQLKKMSIYYKFCNQNNGVEYHHECIKIEFRIPCMMSADHKVLCLVPLEYPSDKEIRKIISNSLHNLIDKQINQDKPEVR